MGVPSGLAISIPSWNAPHLHSNPDVYTPVVGGTALGAVSFILSMRVVILFLTSGFSSVCVRVFATASSAWASGVVAVVISVAVRRAHARFDLIFFMMSFLGLAVLTV